MSAISFLPRVRSGAMNAMARLQARCLLRSPNALVAFPLLFPTPAFVSWVMTEARDCRSGAARSPQTYDRAVTAVNRLLDRIEKSPSSRSLLEKHRGKIQQAGELLFEFFLAGFASLSDEQPEYYKSQLLEGLRTLDRLMRVTSSDPLRALPAELRRNRELLPNLKEWAVFPLGLKLPLHQCQAALDFVLDLPDVLTSYQLDVAMLHGVIESFRELESRLPDLKCNPKVLGQVDTLSAN